MGGKNSNPLLGGGGGSTPEINLGKKIDGNGDFSNAWKGISTPEGRKKLSDVVSGHLGGNGKSKASSEIQGIDNGGDNHYEFDQGNIAQLNKGLNSTTAQQQALVNALQAQNGVGNQTAVFNQQQALANQLQDRANGVGPNPALAQFNQATGQNVSNQAALMAGQRGAGGNVGLMARQAGQQGGNIQQQAVGQSGIMQAQQQIAAQQALGQQQQAMAGMANQQVGQQAGAMQQLGNMQLGQQGQVIGAVNDQNQMNASMIQQGNSIRNQQGLQNSQNNSNMMGGVMQGAGAALPYVASMFSQGGDVQGYSSGGAIRVAPLFAEQGKETSGPQSSMGQMMAGYEGLGKGLGQAAVAYNNRPITTGDTYSGMAGAGDAPMMGQSAMPAMGAAPSEGAVFGGGTQMSYKGGEIKSNAMAKSGGAVKAKSPDQKAVKSGNSYENDKVPAMLSEGEIVIPREVLQSADPIRGAAEFVAKTLAKRK